MKTCIPPKHLNAVLAIRGKVAIDENSEKYTRADIWNIKAESIKTMLKEFNVDSIPDHTKHIAKKVRQSLTNSLEKAKTHTDFVTPLMDELFKGEAKGGRHQAMALKMVLDTIEGELNKASNYGVPLHSISNEAGIPNIPTHRLAATIGRQVLYTQGFRIQRGNLPKGSTAADVENMYFNAGINVLTELQKKGFIKLHDKGTGKYSIRDYIDHDGNKINYKDATTDSIAVVELKAEKLGAKELNDMSRDSTLLQLRGEPKTTTPVVSYKSPLSAFKAALRAVELVSVPQTVVFPANRPELVSQYHLDDYETKGTLANIKKSLESHPTKLNGSLHGFFDLLSKEFAGTDIPASAWLKDKFNIIQAEQMFKFDQSKTSAADRASISGRNLASSVPIDDLVDYFDGLGDKFYMGMFAGRNVRLYMDNTILNPHSSKFMRHALVVDDYSIKVPEKADNLILDTFIDKMATRLKHHAGASELDIKEAIVDSSKPLRKDINKALAALEKFDKSKDLAGKIAAAKDMYLYFEGSDLADTITTLQGVKDAIGALSTGILNSNIMTSSDATASGGQLTLMQALGSMDNVQDLLVRMGVLNGNSVNSPIPDIYAILQEKINEFITDSDEQIATIQGSRATPDNIEKLGYKGNVREILSTITDVLFDGDKRDLAKNPTMVFIYDQQEAGAKASLSKEFTKRFMEKYKVSKNRAKLDKLLVDLGMAKEGISFKVTQDTEFKNDLNKAFADSTAPNILFNFLTEAISTPYLEAYKKQSEDIFKELEKLDLDKVKILPAPLVLDIANGKIKAEDLEHSDGSNIYTKKNLDKYGVPLSKIVEKEQLVEGDVSVLTRIEQIRSTVANVSTIHGADTANLVFGLQTDDGKSLLDEYNSGAIVVHDDIRSRPDLVMEAEQQYIKANRNVAMHYSIHEQLLNSISAYDTENKVTGNENYTKLRTQVNAQNVAKRKVLENDYNFETTAVIGDKPINRDGDKSTKRQAFQPTVGNSKQNESQDGNTETRISVEERLETLRGKSEIINKFLSLKNLPKIDNGDASAFISSEDKVVINNKLSDKQFMKEAEHEIVHSYTTAMIQKYLKGNSPSNELRYIQKALWKLEHPTLGLLTSLDPEVSGRLTYILGKSSEAERIAEFISVMTAEPEAASAIYGIFEQGTTLKRVIANVVKRVQEIISKITDRDVESSDIDVEKLYSSFNSLVNSGMNLRESNYEVFKTLQEGFNQPLFSQPQGNSSYKGRTPTGVLDNISHNVDKLNDVVARYTVQVAEKHSIGITKSVHKYLKVKVPSYMRVVARAKGFYDDSKNLRQLMHKITNSGINQLKKNEILSLFQAISADKETITSKELGRFSNAYKTVSDVDKKAFEDFSSQMSLLDYFVEYPDGIKDIDAELALLSGKLTSTSIRKIESIVDFNVHDVVNNQTKYNLHNAGLSKGENKDNARKLLVVKSIKAIGVNRFRDLLKNQELVDVTRDNLLANAAILAREEVAIDTTQLRDNGLSDSYKEPVSFKVVSMEEFKGYDSNKDWEILRAPTKNSPGVVFQKVIDGTFQSSVFTTLQINTADLEDNRTAFKGKNGVIDVDGKQKIILTRKEKLKAGLTVNPAQSIVRTMTHNLAIQDSEVIRRKLLESDTTYDIKEDGLELLVKQIKSNPDTGTAWFLNDIDDRNFNDLPKDVKAVYMRIPTSVSQLNSFDTKVKYVRKDIAYWLVGNNEKSIATNRTIQTGIKVLKGIIGGTKIGMVILNPVKIAADNLFNFVYLGTLGMGPVDTAKRYNSISKEFHNYHEIKDELQSLMVRAYADEGKYKQRIKDLQTKLSKHPINGVVKRGFINSLGSEIIMQEDSPGSGFKHDIDKVLKLALKDKEGKNNAVGRTIMRVAKASNLSMEGFLEVFSKTFTHTGSTKTVEDELLKIADRFKDIKSNDDVVAYLHQYMNSPDSEFVKLGTHMTDLTDVLAKESYYRHLTEKMNMPEGDAEKEVLKVFPDYKEGLPTAIQKLDSVGIVMYPQYWLQMIRAMYRLTEKRPASFGSEVMLSQLMGTQSQLWSQTIFDKAFSNWGLVHNPTNHIGMGSILPTNVF